MLYFETMRNPHCPHNHYNKGYTFNSMRPSDAHMRQWSNQHEFRLWRVAWSAPSHYQNQCWNIVNKTLRNKLQWIFSRNSNIFIQENVFESVVCEKAAIFSRPQWVDCVTRWYWILRCCCLYVSSSFNTIMWENHHQWTECNCNDGPVINKNTQLPTYRYLSNMTIAISLNIYV